MKNIGTSEAARIADQLRRAFDGVAWHGPALMELLEDVPAGTAAARPLENIHSIWELVLHIAVWDKAATVRLAGQKTQPEGTDNFPVVPEPTFRNWRRAIRESTVTHNALVKTVESLPDSRLRERVPGKRYDFYHNLHGVVQHELYHAGQIAILKKVLTGR
ncbi:MAG TPA: DinB family protein [Candidatus Sulfotelmatobacter sp.]